MMFVTWLRCGICIKYLARLVGRERHIALQAESSPRRVVARREFPPIAALPLLPAPGYWTPQPSISHRLSQITE